MGGGRRLGGRGTGAVGAAGGQQGAVAGARGVTLAGGVAAAGGGVPGQAAGPPPIFKQEVRIVADEVTNSLVILATKRDYQLILDVLKRIDVMPRQVLLEVMIAEITLRDDLRFGVEFALADGRLNQALPQGGGTDSVFRNRAPSGDMGGLINGIQRVPTFPPGGAFAVITDRENFNIFINALEVKTNVKMLSAPHIIAADNREAHILVGNSIPILTQSSQSTLAQANIVNSVQYRDTGKILTILPQVNSKGLVNMQIRQEVSDVGDTSFGQTGSPSFITREAETTVVVQDGDTVLIGGIIDDSIDHTRRGIPYLMDIPFVGRAFRVENDSNERTELLVLITPNVVRDRGEARQETDVFTSRVRGLRSVRGALRRRQDWRRHDAARPEGEGVPAEPGVSEPAGRPAVPPAASGAQVVAPPAAP
jgi:general secretion pathway protein D